MVKPTLIPFDPLDPLLRVGLPADYATLTEEGCRQARVNACRQHLLKVPLKSKAALFVRALHFFDQWYLTPEHDDDGNITFDPYFYEGRWAPSAPVHDLFSYALMLCKSSAGVGPRGLAKSYQIAKEALLLMVAAPVTNISYATSTHDLTERFGDRIKNQLEHNERLVADFAPEYGSDSLKPDRGSGAWGMTSFTMVHRSGLFCTSAESRQRGIRPIVYYLDDPEYDAKQSTSMEVKREDVRQLIQNVALPAVAHPGSKISWRGTFVSKQHYLWAALQTREVLNPDGTTTQEPELPEFGVWHRIIVPLILPTKDGPRSAWPEVFPIDEAEKQRLALPEDAETIPQLRKRVTEPVFQAEYLANPGDAGTSYFGKLTEEAHGWWQEGSDPSLIDAPYKSEALLCFWRSKLIHRYQLRELTSKGFTLYQVADTSYTESITSDYKAVGVLAVSSEAEVFMLDLFAGKLGNDPFAREVLAMSMRWRTPVIYVAKKGGGETLIETLSNKIRDNASALMREWDWVPSVIGFPEGTAPKESRIASSLTRRFELGMVKLPLRWQAQYPWSLLFNQIRGFNPYARNGGLQSDDCLDVLGIGASSVILKGLPSLPQGPPPPPDRTQLLKDGQLIDPKTGIPNLAYVLHTLSDAEIDTLMAARAKLMYPTPSAFNPPS